MLRLAALRAASQVRQAARGFATAAAQQSAPAPAAGGHDLDWDGLAETIGSDSGKRELQLLRSTFLDTQSRLADMEKEPEAINWTQWKKEMDPKLVSAFEQAYNSMPIPKFENSGEQEVSQAFDALEKQADELSKHSETRMKEIEQEIKALDKELERVKTLTIDEVLENEPELGKRLHAEISEGKFLN